MKGSWRLVAAAVMAASSAVAQTSAGVACPIAKAKHAPAIDGVMSEGEYDEGVTFAGFLNNSPAFYMPPGKEGTVTFMSDGKTLFAAWRVKANNVDIGGGLRAVANERDGAVWGDDAVELVLEGDEPGRTAHFIINPSNVVYDRLRAKAGDAADLKWNCEGMRVAGRVLHGWWELEVAIPFASVGSFKNGFSVNAARSVPGGKASSLTAVRNYMDGEKLRFVWSNRAIAFHMTSLGNPSAGEWRPVVKCTAGPPDAKVRVDFVMHDLLDNGGAHKRLFATNGTAAVGGEAFAPVFNTRLRNMIRCKFSIRNEATGKIMASRTINARRGMYASGVPPTAEFDVADMGEALAFHYPGLGKVRFRFYPASGRKIDSVRCTLGGKTVELERSGDGFTALVPTPDGTGSFPVSFVVSAAGALTTIKDAWTLEKKRLEWEGNKIGTEKTVIPPFKPIEASGGEVSVLLRKYDFGAAGVPRGVNALGRDILAPGGAFYELEMDGRTNTFAGSPPSVTIQNGGHDAVLASVAEAAGVKMRTNGRLEYDGFIWNEVALSGIGGRSIDRLTLVVPFKDSEAPLMHICTVDSIRFNPTGKVPDGEGVVWDGTKLHRRTGFADLMFAPQVVPYVWLGAERRGLCWFINNSACLRIAKDRAAVRIVRRDGVLRLEVDLVNVPTVLAEGHVFAFGMEATPVKEADKSLRRQFQTSAGAGSWPKGMVPRLRARCNGIWSWARRPYNDDWDLFRICMRQISSGGKFRAEYEAAFTASTNRYEDALREYASALPPAGNRSQFDHLRSIRNYGYTTALNLNEPAIPYMYSDPTLNWEREEDQAYYRSEWVSRPTGYLAANRNFLAPSCIDYCIYYYKKHTDLGLVGLYFDDMYPAVCRNPDLCMERDASGAWHGNMGILEMRALVKRAATMQHLAGQKSRLMQMHMTNCLLVPSFAFATSLLSWEDHFGNDIYQKRFSVDYVRAESLGTQVGAEAMALDGIQPKGWDKKDWKNRYRKFLTRTQQALLLPAGVKTSVRPSRPDWGVDCGEYFKILAPLVRFETWTDDCEFKAFFEDDHAVGGAPEGVLTGTYRKPGKVLAIFGDSCGKDVEFPLVVDTVRLGLGKSLVFRDGESGAVLDGGKVKLPAWDLRIVEITSAPDASAKTGDAAVEAKDAPLPIVMQSISRMENRTTNPKRDPGLFGDYWWANRFLSRHRLIEEYKAKGGEVDLVLVGDSITHFWEWAHPAAWAKLVKGGRRVLNLGYGGDGTQNVIWRIEHGELDGYRAKVVVLMIGTNNNSGKRNKPEDVARATIKIIEMIRARQPQAKLVVHPIFPRGLSAEDDNTVKREKNARTSAAVKAYVDLHPEIAWVDFNDRLVDGTGWVPKAMMTDGLHPTDKGYDVWLQALEPFLQSR